MERDRYELRKFGEKPDDRGIYRPGLTETDMEARKWLIEQFEVNGLETRMDGAGNVLGRRGGSEKPAVAVGSHTDSVPCGGLFDGAHGVISGLECIGVMHEAGIERVHPIAVLSMLEEEGRCGGRQG